MPIMRLTVMWLISLRRCSRREVEAGGVRGRTATRQSFAVSFGDQPLASPS
jgi:hypothetical protein